MLSADELAEQQKLLAAHRRTLIIYLHQQAEIGRSYSPPSIINGIAEARHNIRRIKQLLRDAGVDVADHPDDDDSPMVFVDAPQAHASPRTDAQQRPPRSGRRQWLFSSALIAGLVALSGLLVAYYMISNQTTPIEISAYCAVFNQSPTDIKADQPVILNWKWRTANEGYRQDYIDAASFSLQIDGQAVDTSSAVPTLSEESGQFVVAWRLPPRTFSIGTHQVVQTVTLSRQITDGYDGNNDGTRDAFGPGVISNPPCEINAR